MAIRQMCVLKLSGYTFGTSVYLKAKEIDSGIMTFKIANVDFFTYLFFIVFTITIISLVFAGTKRLNFKKAINDKKEKKGTQ